MYNRHAILFPIVLALLLALITFWISETVQEQGPKIDGSNRHDPDYVLTDFVTSQTDIKGDLRYVLAAAEMQHFPDDDTTVLQRPRFTQFGLNKPYTQIQGLRGYVSGDGETVEFVDNVKVIRQATADKGQMELTTEKLTIEPNKELASTNSPVLIKQAPNTEVKAVGMVFDKKNQTIQLFNRVHAHYERPKPKAVKQTKQRVKPLQKRATPIKTKPRAVQKK